MRSILIVSEAFTIGGLETYIRGEVISLSRAGYDVHLAVGSQFSEALLPPGLASLTSGLSFESQATTSELIDSVEKLRKIIQNNSVELIHAHPFVSLISSFIAAELEKIPFTLTLHGPASLYNYYGPIYDFILKSVILPKARLVVAVSKEVGQIASPYVAPDSAIVLPNGVDVHESIVEDWDLDNADLRWLLVSRLDSLKLGGIVDFIEKAKTSGLPGILLVGDGPAKEELTQILKQHGLNEYVEFVGFSTNVQRLMRTCAGVVGMGRVVLEGVANGKPVFLIGYDGVKGLVDKDMFKKAEYANFSGRNLDTIDASTLSRQYGQLKDLDLTKISCLVRDGFSEETLWKKFLSRASQLSPQGSTILGDAYFSFMSDSFNDPLPFLQSVAVLERLGEISYSVRYFEQQLVASFQYYSDKLMDFNLNKDLAERDEQIASLHQVVAERDRRIAGLNQAVTERDGQMANLSQSLAEHEGRIGSLTFTLQAKEQEMEKLKSSTSWVLTRPLRFTKMFLRDPGRSTYVLAKYLFWCLPTGVRQALRGPRHKFVRWVRAMPAPATTVSTMETDDVNWEDFSTRVLSRRNEYKGIFVQELNVEWNLPLYQRPQHLATALGRLGYLVIYKTVNWGGDSVHGFKEVCKNVWITNRHEIDYLDGVVRSVYSTAFQNSPKRLLANGKRGVLIYEYIDHIDSMISGERDNVRRLLKLKSFAFSGGVDYIIASARKLEEEARSVVGKDKVILVPNGVDTNHYRNKIHLSTLLPGNLNSFREKYMKIVGYFGALAPWLWYEVINELVITRPDLGFIFIGPNYYEGADQLVKAENVLVMGAVEYKILPAYAHKFDVCFIPFAPNEIAHTTSPLKLFEYFALEKPVVVTSEMLECTAFDEVFRGNSVASLGKAIDDALLIKDDPVFKARLAQLADDNDWDQRARAMEVIFNSVKN